MIKLILFCFLSFVILCLSGCSKSPAEKEVDKFYTKIDSTISSFNEKLQSAKSEEEKIKKISTITDHLDTLQILWGKKIDSLRPSLDQSTLEKLENESRNRMKETENLMITTFPELKGQIPFNH